MASRWGHEGQRKRRTQVPGRRSLSTVADGARFWEPCIGRWSVLITSHKEVAIVSPLVAILLVLGAGLLVGSQVNSAHEAHAHFTSYRHRTVRGLGEWVRHIFTAVLSLGALALLLYVLLVQYPVQ
jgi:hypothetical protein